MLYKKVVFNFFYLSCFLLVSYVAIVNSSPLELAKQSRQLAASGQLEAALQKSLLALEEFSKENSKDTLYIAYVLDDIASLYYRLNDINKANVFSERAFQAANKIEQNNKNKSLAIAHIARNQGAIAYAGGDLLLARQRYEKSYRLYQSLPNEWKNVIAVSNSLFTLYLDIDVLSEASVLVKSNLQRLKNHRSDEMLFDQYINQIKLGIKSNDLALIEQAQKSAIELQADVGSIKKLAFQELNGRVLIYQSRLPEAKAKLQAIIDNALLNNDSRIRNSIAVANAYYYLGFIYIVQGKVIEAEPVVLESLSRYRKIVGQQHPVTVYL